MEKQQLCKQLQECKDQNINFLELFLNIVENESQVGSENISNQTHFINYTTSENIPDCCESDIETKQNSIVDKHQTLSELLQQNNKLLQKQNQIKNLLKAFQKHVTSIIDPSKKELYCDLYSQARVSFFNLKKIITKRIKDKQTRWNMKLKSILKSKGIGILFNYFLKNEAQNWLKTSKVENKNQLQQLINFLIYLHSHEEEFDAIKTYKK